VNISDIKLKANNCITNDPCVLCGARCDPVGLDIMIGNYLVCDVCAQREAPELMRERDRRCAAARECTACSTDPGAFVGWLREGGRGQPWRKVCEAASYWECTGLTFDYPSKAQQIEIEVLRRGERPIGRIAS
jgi:hypothetical protein